MADPDDAAPGGRNEYARFEMSQRGPHGEDAPPVDAAPAEEPAAPAEGAGESPFSVRSTREYAPAPSSAGTKPFPVVWALAALPVFLLVGWLVGQMPARPKAKPAEAATDFVPVVSPAPGVTGAAPTREPEPARHERLSSWTTLARAEEESQRTGKPILLDFNAEWCGPCRMMKEEVFEDSELGDAVRRAVIPVSVVDRSREDGHNSPEVETLLQNWTIEAFPTLIVYRPGTGRSMQTRGFAGADETVEWIQQAASAVR